MINQVPYTSAPPKVEPGIVQGVRHWHDFMARIQNSVASADIPVDSPRARNFQKGDSVSLQRELMVGKHHVLAGSVGIVTVEHKGGRLFDVRFFGDPSVAVTVHKFDLRPAAMSLGARNG